MRTSNGWKKQEKSFLVVLALITFALMLAAVPVAAANWIFTTIDVPDAKSTVGNDINSRGDIVGVYTGADKKVHGYLLSDGKFTTIDFPNAAIETRAYGINTQGDIVGGYDGYRGFLLREGVFTSIDFPGAVYTDAWGINSNGDIGGSYSIDGNWLHAYVLTKHGEYVAVEPPLHQTDSMIHGINSRDDVVGCWWDTAGEMHGLLGKGGVYSSVDFPGTIIESMNYRINEQGWMAGYYTDSNNMTHGYYAWDSHFVPIDFPGATYTDARGINDAREIVGTYRDAGNKVHGFLRILDKEIFSDHEPGRRY